MGYCEDRFLARYGGSLVGAPPDVARAYMDCKKGRDMGIPGQSTSTPDPGEFSPIRNENETHGVTYGDPLFTSNQINKALPGMNLESIPGWYQMGNTEQSLAASMAGLQELQQGEADYQRRQLTDPIANMSLFQVNPYRGNFYAEQGGFMTGQEQGGDASAVLPFINELTAATLKDTKSTKKRINISEAYARILGTIGGARQTANFVHEDGGQPSGGEFVPIQAEVGEKLIFEDGTTSKVKAKKRHTKMDDDEVTDIVPEGTYVVSDAKKMAMSRDEAGEYSLALIDKPYKLNGKTEMPKEVTLADYFGDKKKLTPARILDNVDRKHKLHDEQQVGRDPFIALTNDFNLLYRQNVVLPTVIQASEEKALKVNAEDFVKDLLTVAGVEKFEYGGKVTKKGIRKYEGKGGLDLLGIGSIVQGVTGILSGILGEVNAKNARKDITRASDRIQTLMDNAYLSQEAMLNRATGAELLGAAVQDPTVLSAAQTPEWMSQYSRLESLQGRAESEFNAARDYAVNSTARNLAPMAEMAARLYGPQAGQAAMAQASQAIADASSKAAIGAGGQRFEAIYNIQNKLSDLSGQAAKFNTDAANLTTQNINALQAGAAGSIANNQLSQANLLAQKTAGDIANLTWKAQGQAATRGASTQNWTNTAFMVGNAAQNYVQNRTLAQNQTNQQNTGTPVTNALGQGQYYNPNYQFGQGNQWQPTYGGWNNTMPQYNPNNLFGGVGMSGRTNLPGYQEMGGFAGVKGMSVSDMYNTITGKKKSSLGHYQEGGFADQDPPNPYPQGTEEARLWQLMKENNLTPSQATTMMKGWSSKYKGEEGGMESVMEQLVAFRGQPSDEIDRILASRQSSTDSHGISQHRFTSSLFQNPAGDLVAEELPYMYESTIGDDTGRVLPFKQINDPGRLRYSGMFTRKKSADSSLRFKSREDASSYVENLLKALPFGADAPSLDIIENGSGQYIVTDVVDTKKFFDTRYEPFTAEELARVEAEGYDPSSASSFLMGSDIKEATIKVSDELGSGPLGKREKLYGRIVNGVWQEVTSPEGKQAIDRQPTVGINSFMEGNLLTPLRRAESMEMGGPPQGGVRMPPNASPYGLNDTKSYLIDPRTDGIFKPSLHSQAVLDELLRVKKLLSSSTNKTIDDSDVNGIALAYDQAGLSKMFLPEGDSEKDMKFLNDFIKSAYKNNPKVLRTVVDEAIYKFIPRKRI